MGGEALEAGLAHRVLAMEAGLAQEVAGLAQQRGASSSVAGLRGAPALGAPGVAAQATQLQKNQLGF